MGTGSELPWMTKKISSRWEFQFKAARVSKLGKLLEGNQVRKEITDPQSKLKFPSGKQQINFAIWDSLWFPQHFYWKQPGAFPFAFDQFEEGKDVYSRGRCLFKVPNLFRAGKLKPRGCAEVLSSFKEEVALFKGGFFWRGSIPVCPKKWESYARRNQSLAHPHAGIWERRAETLQTERKNGESKRDFCSVFKEILHLVVD